MCVHMSFASLLSDPRPKEAALSLNHQAEQTTCQMLSVHLRAFLQDASPQQLHEEQLSGQRVQGWLVWVSE